MQPLCGIAEKTAELPKLADGLWHPFGERGATERRHHWSHRRAELGSPNSRSVSERWRHAPGRFPGMTWLIPE